MADKIAYIVTHGEYSNYEIHAVFSTWELAEAYIKTFKWDDDEGPEIEEWPIDKNSEGLKAGYAAFEVRISPGGDVSKCEVSEVDRGFGEPDGRIWNDSFKDFDGNYTFLIMARDAEHAIKIANERRAKLVAISLPKPTSQQEA